MDQSEWQDIVDMVERMIYHDSSPEEIALAVANATGGNTPG